MKIVMFCDKYLYRKLNMAFPKYSENDTVIGSLFSEDEFDNFHVLDKDFINLAFNPVDGIKDIYLLLIQKSVSTLICFILKQMLCSLWTNLTLHIFIFVIVL